jgi:hypothetical protein
MMILKAMKDLKNFNLNKNWKHAMESELTSSTEQSNGASSVPV